MDTRFDLQPTLTGPRVTLRPIRASDWEGMFQAAANPRVWELHPVSDRYTAPVFREFFDGALASGSAFTIVDHASGTIMGSSRYHGLDPVAREIEIGWTFLGVDYWGGSYNREVKALMLEHAFRFVDTVVFWVGETNFRSQHAMRKIGGVPREGLNPRVLNGVSYRHLVYAITRDTFEARLRPETAPGSPG
ncbi:MAG: GNAT family N-acetyltransferase [Pseudomonadota bacterium]